MCQVPLVYRCFGPDSSKGVTPDVIRVREADDVRDGDGTGRVQKLCAIVEVRLHLQGIDSIGCFRRIPNASEVVSALPGEVRERNPDGVWSPVSLNRKISARAALV